MTAHALPAPAPPTNEQISLAWRHFRGRACCPDTLDAALAHPIYGPCLLRCATLMRRAPFGGPAPSGAPVLGACTYVPPTPAAKPRTAPRDDSALGRWSRRTRIGTHDAKRAAANDTET